MTEVAVQRRPRNRKQLIVAAAAKQFERRGFHDAAIADIAADVGITGPALYRHFRGKQNLLAAAVEFEIEGLEAAYAAPQPGLRDLLEYAAGKSLGQNRASALWERNQAYLDPTVGAELRDRYQKAIAPLREAIQTARPGLDGPAVELLVGGAHAVLSSNRLFRRGKLEPSRARMLMTEAASAVCEMTDLGVVDQALSVHGDAGGADHAGVAPRSDPRGGGDPVRRTWLSGRGNGRHRYCGRDYRPDSLPSFSREVGDPRHRDHSVSRRAVLRCLRGTLGTDDPALALDAALASFVRINVEHGDALSALLTEVVNVPEDERAPIRRLQHDYASEWVALLIRVRPELAAPEAEALTRTAQSVINRMRRQLRGDPVEVRNQLNRLGSAVLGLTGPTSSGHR